MKKDQPEICRIKIQGPCSTLSINTEKHQKHYVLMPGPTGKLQKAALNRKPDSKIKLKHDPITKRGIKEASYCDACQALCKFATYFENAETPAKLLLLVLLSQLLLPN